MKFRFNLFRINFNKDFWELAIGEIRHKYLNHTNQINYVKYSSFFNIYQFGKNDILMIHFLWWYNKQIKFPLLSIINRYAKKIDEWKNIWKYGAISSIKRALARSTASYVRVSLKLSLPRKIAKAIGPENIRETPYGTFNMEIQGNKGVCISVEVGYDSYAVFHTKEGLPELVAHKQYETTLEDLDQLVSLITELVNNKKDKEQVPPDRISKLVRLKKLR